VLLPSCVAARMTKEPKCVNAHDLCWQGGLCPYCEVVCHRDAHGRFASAPTTRTSHD